MNDNNDFNFNDYIFSGLMELDESLLLKRGDLIGVTNVGNVGINKLFQNLTLRFLDGSFSVCWAGHGNIIREIFLTKQKLSGVNLLDQYVNLNTMYLDFIKEIKDKFQITPAKNWRTIDSPGNECDCLMIPNFYECIYECYSQEQILNLLVKLKNYAITNNIVIYIGIPLSMNNLDCNQVTLHSLNQENENYIKFCDKIISLHVPSFFDPLDSPNTAEVYSLKSYKHVKIKFINHLMLLQELDSNQKDYDAFADFED